MKRYLIAILLVIGFIFILRELGQYNATVMKEANIETVVNIKAGMTDDEIGRILYSKKLINSPELFTMQVNLKGYQGKLQAGKYKIKKGSTISEIIDTIVKGQVIYNIFTIPEGYDIKQIAAKLQNEQICNAEKFKNIAKNYAPYSYMKTNNKDVIYKAEGFIFPSTYYLSLDMDERAILAFMVKTFDENIKKNNIDKLVEEKNLNLRDVITMASLVEKEAIYPSEMPLIAGVFYKRLSIGMPIQSDTTIQYLLGKQKDIVTYKDLKIDSKYNSYLYKGLPPGPIASPSMKAIVATIKHTNTDYLYFVAGNKGKHLFSKTYKEHLRKIGEINK
jgi:UPF0755 protein